jgi:hypothetical protein
MASALEGADEIEHLLRFKMINFSFVLIVVTTEARLQKSNVAPLDRLQLTVGDQASIPRHEAAGKDLQSIIMWPDRHENQTNRQSSSPRLATPFWDSVGFLLLPQEMFRVTISEHDEPCVVAHPPIR